MTREEAKELLPIIQAFADGNKLEYLNKDNIWEECEEPWFCSGTKRYRIKPVKPELKYRPFKTKEECWNEMLKHKPFGWVKDEDGQYIHVVSVRDEKSFNYWFENYTFTDEAPFGIKE